VYKQCTRIYCSLLCVRHEVAVPSSGMLCHVARLKFTDVSEESVIVLIAPGKWLMYVPPEDGP
jgi:hypothetical protein